MYCDKEKGTQIEATFLMNSMRHRSEFKEGETARICGDRVPGRKICQQRVLEISMKISVESLNTILHMCRVQYQKVIPRKEWLSGTNWSLNYPELTQKQESFLFSPIRVRDTFGNKRLSAQTSKRTCFSAA